MTSLPTASAGDLLLETPEGYLSFSEGDLDVWAEHLTWCYRMIGVSEGATVAVQDFGTSALSYLGSALLMPTLTAGVAERLGGRTICLDASSERVSLTPAVIKQLEPDVLVVRADVLGLLLETCRGAGVDVVAETGMIGILAESEDRRIERPSPHWRRLLHVEAALVLAPECQRCGHFHLREGLYELDGGLIRNLRLACAEPYTLRGATEVVAGRCDAGSGDRRIAVPDGGRDGRA